MIERYAEALTKFIVKKAAAGLVWLKPFAIDNQLWDGSLSNSSNQLFGSRRIEINVDFCVENAMRIKKLLHRPAVPAPGSGVNLHVHILSF